MFDIIVKMEHFFLKAFYSSQVEPELLEELNEAIFGNKVLAPCLADREGDAFCEWARDSLNLLKYNL